MKGYHAVARPRLRPDIGLHNAKVMAIWPTLEEAIAACMNSADYYYSWGHGISDCTIEPYEGMVSGYEVSPDAVRRLGHMLKEDEGPQDT